MRRIRLEVQDEDGRWSFPVRIPGWLWWLLQRYEI